MRKQKDNYLRHWKEFTERQITELECYLTLNREYTVAEYLTTVTDPNLRKACLSREDRLCAHCPQNEVETS